MVMVTLSIQETKAESLSLEYSY